MDDGYTFMGGKFLAGDPSRKGAGAERVYVATVGHGVEHLHAHLLPPWPGTPDEVAWHGVDEWDGARRADAADIGSTVASLRSLLEHH